MSSRLGVGVREKFLWRGWEFRLERTTSVDARWHMHEGKLRIRVIYRDIKDPDAPPEWSAFILMQGLGDMTGAGTSLESCELALAAAEQDFFQKVVMAVRLVRTLKHGRPQDPVD